MTELECYEANVKCLSLKLKIRRLVVGSPEYSTTLSEIKELDRIIKLYDASMPTYSGHTKIN